MAKPAGSSFDLSVKISDLSDASHLKSLLQNQAGQAFRFAEELAAHWASPVRTVPQGTKFKFSLSDAGNWKTATGIGFGLTATAQCELDVLNSGAVLKYRDDIGAAATSGLPAGPYPGSSYIKLSLDFQLEGNLSGTGSAGAIGISGNAKASSDATLLFAHKVPNGMLLKDAVREALDRLVFAFQPSCAADMSAGDIAQVCFNGTLNCSFTLSYGLAKYSFAAPSVSTALKRTTKSGSALDLPSASVSVGASLSIAYTHSDDFSAIVQKTAVSDASLYLMRAHKNKVSGSIGLAAQVTLTGSSLHLDPHALQQGIARIVGQSAAAKVAAQAGELEETLDSLVENWMKNEVGNGAGLKASWDSQTATTMLFKYRVDLAHTELCDRSWRDFVLGDLRSAVGAGGLVLEPGSGINHQISRSFTLSATFFNFFHAKDVDTYFQSSTVSVAPNGDLRFLFDVGREHETQINQVLKKTRIHFLADAGASGPGDVKLQIEMCETRSGREARHMAAVAGYLSPNPQVAAVRKDMEDFVAAHHAGTLTLTCILEPSAYGKLTCSPAGDRPPQDDSADRNNWQVFDHASILLLGLDNVRDVTWQKWQEWNRAANGATVANRRHWGDWDGSDASTVWHVNDTNTRTLLNRLCLVSSEFMNLCDDLHRLAERLGAAHIPDDWNLLLDNLKNIVVTDVNTDFAKPAVAALLKLSAPQQVKYTRQGSAKTLTCTLTMT
ncbi:MAG TPA: hypothetical protein VL240_01545 [Candidatus Binatia bacterium]|nr:hypothetical protein [Candidatus Binatia bacterium]